MQKESFSRWLEVQLRYPPKTIKLQVYRADRVEQYHGNLDEHYMRDRMSSLLETLKYTSDDERRSRPNPSKIPFEGNVLSNIASYRGAVERYRRFLQMDVAEGTPESPVPDSSGTILVEEARQRFGLERDMQFTLRNNISQLEGGLEITDEGAERSVESGLIDITARDHQGRTVVIELKAGQANQRAVAQILSYMGDVAEEEGDAAHVRGILVASDFDAKAKAAARMVPNLILRRYSVQFLFTDGSS